MFKGLKFVKFESVLSCYSLKVGHPNQRLDLVRDF